MNTIEHKELGFIDRAWQSKKEYQEFLKQTKHTKI